MVFLTAGGGSSFERFLPSHAIATIASVPAAPIAAYRLHAMTGRYQGEGTRVRHHSRATVASGVWSRHGSPPGTLATHPAVPRFFRRGAGRIGRAVRHGGGAPRRLAVRDRRGRRRPLPTLIRRGHA